MISALQSLWRELLGSWWVLALLPILVVARWLLTARWGALAQSRQRFFGWSAWDSVLAPPDEEPAKQNGNGAAVAVMEPAEYRRKWFLELVESALVALFLVFFIIRPFVVQAFYIPSPSMVETLEVNDRILVNKFIYRVHSPSRGDIVVFRPPRRATDQVGDDWIKRVIGVPGDRIAVRDNHLYLNGAPQNEPYVALLNSGTDKPGMVHEDMQRYVYTFPNVDLQPGESAYLYPVGPDGVQDAQYRVVPTTDKHPRPPKDGNDESASSDYIFFARNDPKEGLEIEVPPGHLFVMGDNRNDSEDSHFWGYLNEDRVLGKAFCIFWPLSRVRMLNNPHAGS